MLFHYFKKGYGNSFVCLKTYVTFEVAMLPSQGLKKHSCCSSFCPLQRLEPQDLILICLPWPQEAEHCAHGDQASQVSKNKLQLC